jgi:hypothetical protein
VILQFLHFCGNIFDYSSQSFGVEISTRVRSNRRGLMAEESSRVEIDKEDMMVTLNSIREGVVSCCDHCGVWGELLARSRRSPVAYYHECTCLGRSRY